MMNRMSFSETIFLFFLALIIFGPKKLPEIARMVGKALNEFRRASNEFKSQIEQEIAHLEVEKKTILPPSPTPEGATSRTLSSSSSSTPVNGNAAESTTNDPSATLAAAEDEPLFATEKSDAAEPPPVATEALPNSSEVASPSTQESHV